MTHRGPFQPRTFCDSVILFVLHVAAGFTESSAGERGMAVGSGGEAGPQQPGLSFPCRGRCLGQCQGRIVRVLA